MAATRSHSARTPAPRVRRPASADRERIDRLRGPRRRPGGSDGCLRTGAAQALRRRLRGRRHRRRDRQDGRVQRLPLRPGWASLLHEAEAGRADVGAPDGGRLPHAAPALPHLLRRQVFLVPAHGEGRPRPARALRVVPLCALLPLGAAQARPEGGDLRGLGDRPLRQAPLRRFLPLLHAEALGHPGDRDPLPLGSAADQELLPLEGRTDDPRAQARRRHDPDRGVQVPAPRAGAAVGAPAAPARERLRRPGRVEAPLSSRSSTRTAR